MPSIRGALEVGTQLRADRVHLARGQQIRDDEVAVLAQPLTVPLDLARHRIVPEDVPESAPVA